MSDTARKALSAFTVLAVIGSITFTMALGILAGRTPDIRECINCHAQFDRSNMVRQNGQSVPGYANWGADICGKCRDDASN